MSSQAAPRSPGSVLYRERDSRPVLPVCDHYCGSPALLAKSLALQGRLGPVLDITADCEDGAPAGDELGHALRMAQAIDSPDNRFNRVGARTHPVFHGCFKAELDTLMTQAGHRLAYLTLPKVHSVAEICTASTLCQQHEARLGLTSPVPFQVLIESPAALAEVHAIAAHPRVQALCFGLMDYVSSFEGAIGADALHGARQFEHPLLARALTDISLAAHAHGKVAVHSVTLAIGDGTAAGEDARRAARDFGYQRKWSIHPRQGRADHCGVPAARAGCPASRRDPLGCAGSRLGPHPSCRRASRSCQLPLLVARASAGVAHRCAASPGRAGRVLWRRVSVPQGITQSGHPAYTIQHHAM